MGIDGVIKIYGRPAQLFSDLTQTEPLIEITPDQWKTHEIDVFSFFKEHGQDKVSYAHDNSVTNVKCLPESGAEPRYFDIHLDRNLAIEWLKNNGGDFRGRRDNIHG